MNNKDFQTLKNNFKNASLDEKSYMYRTVENLSKEQYKELLELLPFTPLEKGEILNRFDD